MNTIVYVYNSFNDPLFKGNLLLYLKDRSLAAPSHFFYLITHEQKNYSLSNEQIENLKIQLETENIYWRPLKWREGKIKLLDKFFDLLNGFIEVFKLRFFNECTTILSLGTVAGSMAYLNAKLFNLHLILYQYERHSEFLLDFGIWKSRSASYRILNFLENRSAKFAKIIVTGTSHMINRLDKEAIQAKKYKVPSCVDEKLFRPDQNLRVTTRKSLGIPKEAKVFVYLGKFGGIYYKVETILKLFEYFRTIYENANFLILTPDNKGIIESKVNLGNYNLNEIKILSCSYEEVQKFLVASDFGIVNIPPYPSQKYRSPIKVGEYLCCGIPYLVCRGVSEDDIIAESFNVGVACDDLNVESVSLVCDKIDSLLNENKEKLTDRCRKSGISYRGYSQCSQVMKEVFKEIEGYN